MVFVLVCLAFLSVVGVVWGIPELVPGPGGRKVALMEGYLAPAMNLADRLASIYDTVKHVESPPWLGFAIALAVAWVGGAAGWLVYRWWLPGEPGSRSPRRSRSSGAGRGPSSTWMSCTTCCSSGPSPSSPRGCSRSWTQGSSTGVGVGGTALVLRRLGGWLRYTQTGNAQNYATVMAVGLLISIGVVLTWVLR
jgi:NADH-quinone oxidoreductase subunit L